MEARQKMEKAVKEIQAKADQIYNKFKSNFAFQVNFGCLEWFNIIK